MQASIFLAKLIGPVLALLGIAMMIDPAGFQVLTADFMKSPGLIYLGALLGLFASIALVLTHNVWAGDWRIIITLLGWVGIVDSMSWLLFPRQVAAFWSPMIGTGWFVPSIGVVVLLLGAALCYSGYFASHEARKA